MSALYPKQVSLEAGKLTSKQNSWVHFSPSNVARSCFQAIKGIHGIQGIKTTDSDLLTFPQRDCEADICGFELSILAALEWLHKRKRKKEIHTYIKQVCVVPSG